MATIREIKRRRGSVRNTQQITKAMKLVSTVKLQKVRGRAENSKAYFNYMYKTISSILDGAGTIDHPYVNGNGSGRTAIVAVTSNRGLAGGYNANIVRLIMEKGFKKENTRIYTVGRKGAESLSQKGYKIEEDYSSMIESPSYEDAKKVGERLLADYEAGRAGEIYIAYTEFVNTVRQVPHLIRLLPIDRSSMANEDGREPGEESSPEDETTSANDRERMDPPTPMNFEPEEEEAIALLIPKYMTSILYGAFVEAAASENGARMHAMDSATNNAEDILEDLDLQYNRARQGAITREITEIIAGAEAIG